MPVATRTIDVPDQASIFDKAQGRIVSVTAQLQSGVTQSDVLSYYKAALPAFGWIYKSDIIYVRDQEKLALRFEVYQGETYLHLTISP